MDVVGCGGGGHPTTVTPPEPLVILTPPASQTVPLGSSGTFTVTATGQGTLSYQWTLNGTDISGATSASYTTPPTALSDNGAVYAVVVTDADNSATAGPAKLTIGARSPKPGDLRFQQVDAPSVALEQTNTAEVTNIEISLSGSHSVLSFGGIGSPLELGPPDWNCSSTACSWGLWLTALPAGQTGLSMLYTSDNYEFLNADLAALPSPNSVVTCLDIQAATDVYGIAVTGTSSTGGFDLQQEVVPAAAVQSTVNADGLKSRVITAVSFDGNGQAHLLSYGWQADTTTLYDTTTAIVAAADIAATAANLSNQGYIITAFGGNTANGYVLVGTKVQGDTLPRLLLTETITMGVSAPLTTSVNGYAPVARVEFAGPNDQPGAASSYTALFQQ